MGCIANVVCLKYVCMTLESRHVCATRMAVRGQLWSHFSHSTFTWVLRIEFKLTALYSQVLYILSHLTAYPPPPPVNNLARLLRPPCTLMQKPLLRENSTPSSPSLPPLPGGVHP